MKRTFKSGNFLKSFLIGAVAAATFELAVFIKHPGKYVWEPKEQGKNVLANDMIVDKKLEDKIMSNLDDYVNKRRNFDYPTPFVMLGETCRMIEKGNLSKEFMQDIAAKYNIKQMQMSLFRNRRIDGGVIAELSNVSDPDVMKWVIMGISRKLCTVRQLEDIVRRNGPPEVVNVAKRAIGTGHYKKEDVNLLDTAKVMGYKTDTLTKR